MTSKTVVSPAGESIEIVSNEDWIATVGVPINALSIWTQGKPYVIRELYDNGGISDTSGFAMTMLVDRINKRYPKLKKPVTGTAANSMMTNPTNAPAFERSIKGKRTYEVKLVALPQAWYDKLEQAKPSTPEPPPVIEPAPPEVEALLEQPVSVNGYEPPAPIIDVDIASQVAMSLLTTVVEIISAGSPETTNATIRALRNEVDSGQALLAKRLEENERLRNRMREASDELQAVKHERDGLRQRLRNTEANLTAALKGESAHAINAEVHKRLDQIMRTTPRPKGE